MTIKKEKNLLNKQVYNYIQDLISRYKDGNNSTEHTHRGALQTLIEASLKDVMATNEPQRIDCGAPDFIITQGNIPIGYVEAKDLDVNLDGIKLKEDDQMVRYLASLDNLILTNYLEFRWFVKGELRSTISIGSLKNNKIEFYEKEFSSLISLLNSFKSAEIPTIKSASELAERLAACTKTICHLIIKSYEFEDENGYLHKWLAGFKTTLIANLDVERFADMFAQTLVYGYFSASINKTERDGFSRESAARILPETNPFLRRLFHEFVGIDMPKSIDWAVDEVVEILKRTVMAEVLKDFGSKSGKNDPIFHFYETFLEKYDPELKDALGAYYTPQPVINYIVKSVDEILETQFGRKKGLADKNTLVLDPALGTGSFLYHVIKRIQNRMRGQSGTWPQYVSENLLNRVFGFEIMMAPYAISHLKIGNQLKETGYKFNSGSRLGIYLTNTLEEAAKKTDTLLTEFISVEANEASSIKSDKPIVAIMGNPPYKGFAQNQGEWIQGLMEDYKDELGEKKSNSDNDYMKFIRFAQWRIDKTGYGVAAFITPNSYLDGLTLRQMRASLLESFSDIYILNLHGSAIVENDEHRLKKDKNVFDIRQGVSISIFVRNEAAKEKCKVHYSEIIGSRDSKYKFLEENSVTTTKWKKLNISKDRNFFSPTSLDKNLNYLSFLSVKEIFPVHTSGIQPKKKDVAIQFSKEEMEKVVNDFATASEKDLAIKYGLHKESTGWKISWAQAHACEMIKKKQDVTCIQYRTFDYRWTVIQDHSSGIVGRPRYDVMKHMKGANNLGLIVLRQLSQSSFQHAWVSRRPIDENTISRKTREYNYIFPLFLEPDPDQLTTHQQRINISEKAISTIKKSFGLDITSGVEGDFIKTISPEQFFYYVYACLHSPHYRKTFFSELKIDFPRIPMFMDKKLVKSLSSIGSMLSTLHLLEHSDEECSHIKYEIVGTNKVSSLKYNTDSKQLWINSEQYFDGVQESVWTFKIGGHEVLREFFTDRTGRLISSEEIETVRKIIFSIEQTIDLMKEVDNKIAEAGGWTGVETFKDVDGLPKNSKKKKVA